MNIEYNKHVTQSITFDTYEEGITAIRMSHWASKEENDVCSVLTLHTGACDIQIAIAPNDARRLAAKLLDHAADVDTLQMALAMAPEAA
jgi:hypothetical protein